MQSDIQNLLNLPDISFIDNITIDELLQDMINDYESEYSYITGTKKTLYPFDPDRIKLQSVSLKLYQIMQYIDRAGKMNLLKYSQDEFLDHVGALKGVYRKDEAFASAIVRFSISDIQNDAVPIFQNTRVSAGKELYFDVDDYMEIPPGALDVDVPVTCMTAGSSGNGFYVGQINTLVDPIPLITSVSNITASEGGADKENDDDLRERIYLAPSSYSTAGPEDAYVYWTKYYSNIIKDVKIVTDSSGGTITIFILNKNGEIPGQPFLDSVENFITNMNIKPSTDKVIVSAPEVINYDIELTYYINKSDENNVTVIKSNIETAVNDYISWQKQIIGRDINTNKLVSMIIGAGAKRADVISPNYTVVSSTSVAVEGDILLTFGGIEDD